MQNSLFKKPSYTHYLSCMQYVTAERRLSAVFQLCESRSHRIKLYDVGRQLYAVPYASQGLCILFLYCMSRQILSHHHITLTQPDKEEDRREKSRTTIIKYKTSNNRP